MPPHVLTGGRLQSVLHLFSPQKSCGPTTWSPYSAEADNDGRLGRTTPRISLLPLPPCLPGQSFAIEHQVYEKKSKLQPFLIAARVEDAKGFVAVVLGASSGRLGPNAGAFFWNTCGPFVASLSNVLEPDERHFR